MTPAPQDRAARAARSGAAVGAAVLVALGAHLAGGGAAPAPVLLIAVLALAWPVGLLLVGRRPGPVRQTAVVGAAQAMLHGVFALGGTASTASAATDAAGGMSGMAGMHGAVPPVITAVPMQHGSSMQWTHLLAWAVTVVAWRWGGAALRRVRTRLSAQRILALLAPLDPAASSARPLLPVGRAPRPAAPLTAHRDRGPPLPA